MANLIRLCEILEVPAVYLLTDGAQHKRLVNIATCAEALFDQRVAPSHTTPPTEKWLRLAMALEGKPYESLSESLEAEKGAGK